MHTCPLASVIIKPDRQRTEFDPTELQNLKDSIEYLPGERNRQLLHPPVLRREGNDLVLVAGERRLRAIKEIFALGGSFIYNGKMFDADSGMIPFSDIGELSPLEAEEAELDENLKRVNLSWQELAQVHARLHKLRTAQRDAASPTPPTPPTSPSQKGADEAPATPRHTIADTALEVFGRSDGAYQDTIRKETIVAKHLDNPAVAKAKTLDEAFKILKKEEERKTNIALGLEIGKTFNADKHTLVRANCIEWMAQQPAGQFDVILTDPPYGMGADAFGDAGGKMTGIQHHYDDSHESWAKLMEGPSGWCSLAYRITKSQAHAYVFCDIDRFHELRGYMVAAGWDVFRTPLIVHKLNSGRVPRPQHGPRRQWEMILYAIKGDKPVTHIYPDVIPVNGDDNLGHGAQKPVDLYVNLLQRSVKPGDSILDTFAGTGTIFPAAHTFKCAATGIEFEEGSYGICVKRLAELKNLDTPATF
jgi:site-specific DNA-methyltransferase (adenine-specific)